MPLEASKNAPFNPPPEVQIFSQFRASSDTKPFIIEGNHSFAPFGYAIAFE